MNYLELPNYNLNKTLLGGQAFNWDYINGYYCGFAIDKLIKITPNKNGILWQTYPDNNDYMYISNLLNIDIDFDLIIQSIQKDENIKRAVQYVENVRILKQGFDQTLMSFILTSHKSIKAVRKIVRDLSKTYGNPIEVDNMIFYTFPSAKVIASLTEDQLRCLGAGFRAKYLLNAAKALNSNTVGSWLADYTEEGARNKLLELNGVGDKIADCILTFSLGFYTVTPIDVWALRVLHELYKVDPKSNYKTLRKWYADYFNQHTAWAGQFLFEYLRENYKHIKRYHS